MKINDMSQLLKSIQDLEAIVKIIIDCENDNPEPLAHAYNKLTAYEDIKEIVSDYIFNTKEKAND